MAHVPFRADIDEVSQGNAVRWNAAEEFYNNQGSNITLQHMSARHIIVFPSANITVTLPDVNTLIDGWQVHVGFPFSTADNPYEITVKDAAGAEWRRLIKGQWCECVKKGGSWYVYPPGSVADIGAIVPGNPPPQPPTVPSGTVLESLNTIACPPSNPSGSLGGGIISVPATKSGYVRKFSYWLGTLNTMRFTIFTAIISGSTFTKKKIITTTDAIRPATTPNCGTITLPSALQVDVGDYIGSAFSSTGGLMWAKLEEVTIATPPYFSISSGSADPSTLTGSVTLTNKRLVFNCNIEA